MKTDWRILLCLILLAAGQMAHAKSVKLITIGPGAAYWSAFGHTAIAVGDDVYGFGYFSFDDDIFTEFISNQMQYEVGLSDINTEFRLAQRQQRDFSIIDLIMTEAEVEQLESYLKWHNLPENRSYQYDYFLNNCATKIRDILDQVWQGQLAAEAASDAQSNYYKQSFPAKKQGWMNFGLAVGYGWMAYDDRTDWELMAFPVFLEKSILELMPDKVRANQSITATKAENTVYLLFRSHWLMIAYVIFWTVLLFLPQTKRMFANAWFKWHALIGLVMLLLWFLTPHAALAWNFNVLLFSPLGFFVKASQTMVKVIFLSILLWLVMVCFAHAWYLLPLLLPALMALKSVLNSLNSNKTRLSFAGISECYSKFI
ncbi:DUF4105 domain-containing protein [Marinicella sp. S1101]|uniref:lipoprotein N-acyltransferase Lnb domain-containing protein n=1 Tax=Marinicella marina TaxID=2996016 RepID=UPI00226099ED|nr:DUF4105 domain-containing protein [Marinicella marina]MCX7553548.1 DUF4105 domain-containing protein [Marinicella marina]MDJ1140172.1 DUF4105 domain-containing protein [Marinicella marina]